MILFFLPSLIFVTLKVSSLALGLGIASLLILLLNYKIILEYRYNVKWVMLFVLFFLLLFISSAYIFIVEDIAKPLHSLVFVCIMISSFIFSKYLSKISFEEMKNSVLIFILLLLFIGWLKLFYIPECCNYDLHLKATFPFSEESHFALVLGMLAIAYSFFGELKWVLFILLNCLGLALLYPSLALLVFVMFVIFSLFMRLKPIIFKFFIFIFLPILLVLFLSIITNIDYFASRLSFSDSNNLTTLVFLQGWQLAYLNFIETNGIGLGYQMLGSSLTQTGPYTDAITSFASGNRALNIEDGGFLAAKLIAEFGVLGVLVVVFYIYWIIKIIFKTNYLHNRLNITDAEREKLLMYGIIFGFLVEMLLRGYGYFSPGLFLMITSIMYLNNQRINRKMNK